MKAFLALMRREFIEHRASFFYAPLAILALLTLLVLSGLASGNVDARIAGILPASPKFYELFYGIVIGAWWFYLIAALFFYCADAFSADRRNNALLFWKSMPQGDTRILWSKFVSALTMFPALVVLTMLLSGMVAAAIALWASGGLLSVPVLAGRYLQVSLVALVYVGISVLWYAPFLAWVGGLSTAFGRWSIPLAALIPGLFIVIEAVYGRTNVVWRYLQARLSLKFGGEDISDIVLLTPSVDAGQMIPRLLAGVDWFSVVTGLVFVVIVMAVAGQYRRRVLR